MLPLPPFDLLQPDTVEAATRLLADHPDARVVSGGTDLLPSMKYGLFDPPLLVSTSRIAGFRAIADLGRGLAIGAGATLSEVRRHPLVRRRFPALARACATVATPTIQEMGTIGGNVLLDTRCIWYNASAFWRGALGGCLKKDGALCHVAPRGRGCYAAHSADTVPVLLLLDAEVELRSVRGTRRLPLARLHGDDGRTPAALEPGELLTRILLPAPPRGRLAHRKLRARGAIDYPLLLTAVRLDEDDRGRVQGGRIVLSAIGPRPIEVEGAHEALAAGDPALAAETAWRQAFPLSTHHAPSTWRKHMVRVEVRRAVASLLEREAASA